MAQQPRISYQAWLAKRGPKARQSTAANRDAWRRQVGLPAINNKPKPPETGNGVPTASQSNPGDSKPPDPWNPTLDYMGVQDENDLTNQYNQGVADRTRSNTERLADLTKAQSRVREAYANQVRAIASNAASRGIGRSGIRDQNDLENQTQTTQSLNDIDTERTRETTGFTTDLQNMGTNYQSALSRNRAAAGQREMATFNDNTRDGQLAPEIPADTTRPEARATNPPPPAQRPTWAQFVATHTRPTNQAGWAALRAKYLKRFGNG